MTTCRTNVSVAVVGDRLWAVGGFSGKVFLNTVEYLDPDTDEWTSFITLPEVMLKRPSKAATGNGSSAASITSEDDLPEEDEEEEDESVIKFSANGQHDDSNDCKETSSGFGSRYLKSETTLEEEQAPQQMPSNRSSPVVDEVNQEDKASSNQTVEEGTEV